MMQKLFDTDPMERRVVLSASRMTDMPKYYPLDLIREIDKRKEKGTKIHTLVLWTKHPGALLKNPLHQYLEKGVHRKVDNRLARLG